MSKTFIIVFRILFVCTFFISGFWGCKKFHNPIKYAKGTFPDSIINIEGLNSQYDDYNSAIYILGNTSPIIFSSNRGTSGGTFDLVQGNISFQFDQTTGVFQMSGEMTSDPFFNALLSKANTAGDDLGPYTLLSSADGYEYLILASRNGSTLDMYYLKHLPYFGNNNPVVTAPSPLTVLNSPGNDAYISFNPKQDTAFFSSDRDGSYDIYFKPVTPGTALDEWFNQDFSASEKLDSVNSSYDDKCPFVYRNIMVFASDRPGGLGGYDLYYSLYKNDRWSFPVNFGPGINSAYDEFRPLVGYHPSFTNNFMIFSSNRPGGKGGYDLYFTGYSFGK